MDRNLEDLLHLLSEEELIRIRRRAEKAGNRFLVELLSAKINEYSGTAGE